MDILYDFKHNLPGWNPPLSLHYDGDLRPMTNPKYKKILVIGTHDPFPSGLTATTRIVEALKDNPARTVILSGLSMGISTCAHRAAIACGLPTCAVMATGLDDIYPYSNRDMATVMREKKGCALITQFPEKTEPLAINYLERTKTMVAMSDVVIVVASRRKGTSIVAARLAHDAGIPVYAVPGSPDDISHAGCNQIILEGTASIVTDYDMFKSIQL